MVCSPGSSRKKRGSPLTNQPTWRRSMRAMPTKQRSTSGGREFDRQRAPCDFVPPRPSRLSRAAQVCDRVFQHGLQRASRLRLHVQILGRALVIPKHRRADPALHRRLIEFVIIAPRIAAQPGELALEAGEWICRERRAGNRPSRRGCPLTRPSIISGTPATNGSRLRPTAGSSKTHVPLYQYGAITMIALAGTPVRFVAQVAICQPARQPTATRPMAREQLPACFSDAAEHERLPLHHG